MPELPEVETIVRDLAVNLTGTIIKDTTVFNAGSLNVSEKIWRRRVIGQKIKRVWRRGKQAIFDLSGGEHIVIHLKMTGQLIYKQKNRIVVGGHPIVGLVSVLPNKFSRVVVVFNDGARLFFNDVRKFGWLKILTAAELSEQFAKLGVEPLDRSFTAGKLQAILQRKPKTKLKAALLDQANLVGLGNIYVDESLWLSGLKPSKQVAAMRSADWLRLTAAIKKVLRLSIKYRGTSFSDYRDATGSKGNFLSKLKVYGRANQTCVKCGRLIVKTRLVGRGTHWCEKCQK